MALTNTHACGSHNTKTSSGFELPDIPQQETRIFPGLVSASNPVWCLWFLAGFCIIHSVILAGGSANPTNSWTLNKNCPESSILTERFTQFQFFVGECQAIQTLKKILSCDSHMNICECHTMPLSNHMDK